MLQSKISSVTTPLGNSRLLPVFDGEGERALDIKPYASDPWYGELFDVACFKKVRILDGGSGAELPHGQDIAVHERYDLSVPVA